MLSQTQQDANARGCSGTSPAFNASLGRCFKPDLQSDNTDNADNADESDEDDEEENDVSSFLSPTSTLCMAPSITGSIGFNPSVSKILFPASDPWNFSHTSLL